MKSLIFFLSTLVFQFAICSIKERWTWSYQKKFSQEECKNNSSKNFLVFSKINTPKFSQLIFSWNAYRPKKGHFVFYGQSRNAATKEWGNWYKMIEWGDNVQKSHCVKKSDDINYHYVRLEIPYNKLADGFKIKVESENDVNLSDLIMISVCISDFSKFSIESLKDGVLELSSIKIRGIPKISQMALNHEDNRKICSPTSTSMLVSYLLKQKIDPLIFANNVYDNGLKAYGSWPFNTAHAFEKCSDYLFRVMRLNSFEDLYSYIAKKLPVVVSVRGRLNGAPQGLNYNSGHLILITGWDQKNKLVHVHDPAFDSDDKVQHHYEITTFLRAWERSHRLAYVVEENIIN